MRLRTILTPIGIILLIVINLTPLVWGALTSIKASHEIMTYPPVVLSFSPTLEHYRVVLDSDFPVSLRNTSLYAIASVVLGVLLASLAAYGFDRFRFKFRQGLFLLVVASIPLSIGAAALLIPNYLYFTYLGLTNEWFTLALIYTAYTLPMAVWIMKGSIEGIPRELDEAAYVDGASSFKIYRLVILPLTKPALAAAGLLLFMHAWNEFVAGSIMVESPSLRPVQVAIYQFIGFFGRDWGPLTAAATLAIIPVLFVYLVCSGLMVSGLTHGAVKH
jgi:multiple sugar transport system permease protein